MNMIPMSRHSRFAGASCLRAVAIAFLATCLALPVHAATSFPDYPLQTGVGSVPPNIMFILDNSGSMALISMPTNNEAFDAEPEDYSGTATGRTQVGLGDNPHDRSYLNNGVYYNPNVTYKPWMTADGVRRTGGTSVDAVYKSWSLASGDTRDIRDSRHSVFYVPHAGVTRSINPDPADYDRYWVRSNGVSAEVVRFGGATALASESWSNENIQGESWWQGSITVPQGATRLQVTVADGSGGDADLYVRFGTSGGIDGSSTSRGNNETVVIQNPSAGIWQIYIYNDNRDTSRRNDIVAVAERRNVELATPTGRSQAEELTNIATWYSYYRSRMKTAKAGASEAFATLGRNFRVGYTPINGRSPDLDNDGDDPIIPVDVNGGLFESANKQAWFRSVHDAQPQNGSTPLRSALNAVGQYYMRSDADGPWGAQAPTDQLSCRQSFAILTTDGYWNDSTGYTFGLGDEDGDGHSVTLADVADYYYDTDLRTDLENNVPGSRADSADWQHMVTFGISIGLQGTLPITDPPPASNAAVWPNPMNGENADRIDDLWHAAVNSHGEFIAAANADDFAEALKSALSNIAQRRASGSNVASNGPQLSAGSKIFQATFTSGEWSGDVQAFGIASGNIAASPSWSVADVANAAPAEFLNRGVYTWDHADDEGAEFPTDIQVAALERTNGVAPVSGEDNAAYIEGDRSSEGTGDGDLRERSSPIGDIVNSSPFYAEETGALFIGANDGMLHSINSATGAVQFSYLPAGLDFAALATLSDPEYRHRFFVDGGIDVSTRAQGKDRNILVASLGRGGKGVFALDVTEPDTFDDDNVLWDRTFSSNGAAAADSDMGYVLGAPLVRQGHNGKTLVMVGNGLESQDGEAVLFIYVLNDDGTLNQTVELATGVSGGNGLAPPRAADVNLDGIADYVYAGDLKGNLWKFDLTAASPGSWTVQRLFTAVGPAGEVQPITAAVSLAREPVTDRIFVSFGTGKYISNGDLFDTSTQTLYSLIDEGTAIAGRDELHERTIPYTGVDSLGRAARAWESYSPLPETAKGWYVDLGIPTAGERVVTAPFVRGRALWFSSIIPQPGSGCDSGGTGYLNAVDVFTGTNPLLGGGTGTYIDVNADGDGNDKLDGAPTDGDEQFITSVDLGVGMIGQGTGVGNAIYACGSEAECGFVPTPPDTSGAKRLGWRELFNRD